MDFPFRQIFKSGNHPECRRLAAAGRSEERKAFSFFNGKVKIIDCRHRTQRFCREPLCYMFQYDLVIHGYTPFLSFVICVTMKLHTMMITMAIAAKADACGICPLSRSAKICTPNVRE